MIDSRESTDAIWVYWIKPPGDHGKSAVPQISYAGNLNARKDSFPHRILLCRQVSVFCSGAVQHQRAFVMLTSALKNIAGVFPEEGAATVASVCGLPGGMSNSLIVSQVARGREMSGVARSR